MRHELILPCIISILITGCGLDENTTGSDLAITPTSVTLEASSASIIEFAASGGNSNYTWSLSDYSLGTLYTATLYTAEGTALYENTTNIIGTNTLTLRDDDGNAACAKIRQR
jgi:hypothetical protein